MIVLLQSSMPRQKSHTKDDLVASAMHRFWQYGYEATSLDDLVKATGVSRHGIYSDVGNKERLYLASFEAYQILIVTPALEGLESADAGLAEIQAYFETQIALAESIGLPGPGCLAANAMTETAPHNKDVANQVDAHNARLTAGFLNALKTAATGLPMLEQKKLARFLTVTAQGLWSMSRTVGDAKQLREYVSTLMLLIEGRIER